ncbi:MAG: WD40/YVTN/BNR-like repeat-containing protein [Acidimicrobiales bacterium]
MKHRLAAALGLALAAALPATAPVGAAQEAKARAQIRVTPVDVGRENELFGVSFADAQHGHAVGTDGTILATTDGGTTWAQQQAPLPLEEDGKQEHLHGVSFPTPAHGYMVGTSSIQATTDGGATWEAQALPPPVEIDGVKVPWSFRGVSFPQAEVGWVLGPSGAILSTTNGGQSWQVFAERRFGQLRAVTAVDSLHVQAVGASGFAKDGIPFVTIASADGGRTWEPRLGKFKDDVDPLNFSGVSFVDEMRGFAVGNEGRIVATSDGGLTWSLQRAGSVESLSSVSFTDAKRGVAVGEVQFTTGEQKSVVFATDDGGRTWVSRLPAGTEQLHAVDFADRNTAYAVGCRRNRGTVNELQCEESALLRITFSDPLPAESGSSGVSPMLVAAGIAAVILLGGGFALLQRRRGAVR